MLKSRTFGQTYVCSDTSYCYSKEPKGLMLQQALDGIIFAILAVKETNNILTNKLISDFTKQS